MKRRIWIIVLALLTVLLVLGGSLTVLAGSHRKLTGGMYFVADWGDRYEVWQQYNVQETDPWVDESGVVHNARGQVNYKLYNERMGGWRRVQTTPICVAFGEDLDGTPMATIVLRLDSVRGWGWGEPGEHSKFYIRDGGTPGGQGDQWNMEYYQMDPWIEFWPKDVPPPDCTSSNPDNMDVWWDISRGNLMIH
jgi:hypothetical protein